MCLGPRPAAGLQGWAEPFVSCEGGVEGRKEEVGAAGEAGDQGTKNMFCCMQTAERPNHSFDYLNKHCFRLLSCRRRTGRWKLPSVRCRANLFCDCYHQPKLSPDCNFSRIWKIFGIFYWGVFRAANIASCIFTNFAPRTELVIDSLYLPVCVFVSAIPKHLLPDVRKISSGRRVYRLRDTWHVTRDTWHATCDTSHVWGGEHSLKISAP